MDDKDTYILEALRDNVRTSTATLGRALGVSRATVQNRIDKMVSKGIIAGFTLAMGEIEDESAVEALVLVKVSSVDTRPFVAKLRKIAAIKSFTSLNGQYDFALELRTKTTSQLDSVLADIRGLQHVLDTNCSIRMKKFL